MYEEDSTFTNQCAHNDLVHSPTEAQTSDMSTCALAICDRQIATWHWVVRLELDA